MQEKARCETGGKVPGLQTIPAARLLWGVKSDSFHYSENCGGGKP
jgi:hypothetical protein